MHDERRDGAARWGVILAGGDGTRLAALTRALAGDDRPKQFCRLLGGRTLLDETRQRLALSVSPLRTLFVVTRAHERFFRPALADVPPSAVLAQPENRGTAAAILYALLRLARVAPTAPVVILPSDHYVSDDEAFMAHVDAAFEAVAAHPDRVVLLGITPDRPEVEYGWIEPGPRLSALRDPAAPAVLEVRRFWEKPSPPLAETLEASGCLWNCFVMVGRVPTFLSLLLDAAPDLYHAFAALAPVLGLAREAAPLRTLYATLTLADFSRHVLAARPASLAVLPVRGVAWNDLGEPGRVLATQRTVSRWVPGAAPADDRWLQPSLSYLA